MQMSAREIITLANNDSDDDTFDINDFWFNTIVGQGLDRVYTADEVKAIHKAIANANRRASQKRAMIHYNIKPRNF